jgi:uncharacterized protein (TIGR02453 family)
MPGQRYFTAATFAFLRDLAANNDRDWFKANKPRYEEHVKEPALRLITDFGVPLGKITRHMRADPAPVGGSLFRIHRDTRFAKDKSPYKTHAGLHFRHAAAKDAHAPGYYLHVQPGEVFFGCGIWHPDGPTLRAIRDAIVDDPAGWKRASRGKKLTDRFELVGDSLKRPPRGYDPEHPLVDDLRRKDFIGVAKLTQRTVTGDGLLAEMAALSRAGVPLQRFLCGAIGVAF